MTNNAKNALLDALFLIKNNTFRNINFVITASTHNLYVYFSENPYSNYDCSFY